MSLPREPRQKMINMMYLVLTALLALNVSSEILNAFKTVNSTLVKSNTAITGSTETLMASLDKKRLDPLTADKATLWYGRAKQATDFAADINNYIQSIKDNILTKAGGDPKDPTKSYKDDNLDIATRMMVDKGGGKVLLQKLTDFKKNILGINDTIKTEFENSLPIDLSIPKTQNKSNKTWEEAYFHMVPTVAALTILSKFQNDVKTSENKVVAFCHSKVGEVQLRYDAYGALIGQNSNYLLPGQQLEVKVGVGTYSKAARPEITIGGRTEAVNDSGFVRWNTNVSGLGNNSIPVHIVYYDQNNQKQTIDRTVTYTVGQSNAAVQLDKMNVLFIGVENPVTISGSGSAEQLRVSATGGGIQLSGGAGGHYTAKVNSETDDCVISVTTPDGKTTPVRFRVRSIPDPTPYIGTYESGDIPASVFKSQAGVRAYVKNFFYETQFNVTSFRITGDATGFEEVDEKINTGAAWNEARSIVNKCKPGSFITIEDIRAIGPDGRTRKLTPLIFNLK